MSRFTKFASAAVLVASLAPFAAQARSGDLGTSGPAANAVQSSQHGAFVPGRGAENAQFTAQAQNAGNGRLASNDVPVSSRWVGGAASDSNGG